MGVMHQCVPKSTLPAKKNLPWLSRELTTSIRSRNLAYKRAKRTGTPQHFLSYKQKRNKVVNLLRKAKRKFFRGLNTVNSKSFWKVAKYMTKKNSSIPSLKDGGIAVESDLDKAALLNRYFSKCFNQSVPPLNDEDILEFSSIDPLLCPEEFLCTEHEVFEMLSSLDIKKANGWDGISARMLRSTAASIAHGITLMFNGSLSEGCFASLYADDLLLYKVITCPEDYTTLQSDINSVASWITQHHLSFNTSKCKCMTVTRLRQNSVSPPVLQLNGKPMENVTSYKYLGVTLTSDLTWSDHIHNITRKARRLTGMLYRQFYRWSSPTALSSLYVSLVRPHLEHAAPAWNPYLIKDINSLESVQKFALKVCLKQWDTPYHQLLSQACLPDLSTRRKHLSLCYFYKLINGVHLYHDLPLVPHTSQYALRNNHSLVQFSAHTNCFYYSFFPYVTSLWNTLPDSITSAPSIYTFKNLVHLV